jgi:hypothetical protein
MTDLLTHALAGFIIGTVLSFRYDWIRGPFVSVVMVGAILPDLTKVSLVVPSEVVEATLGVAFDWFALHTPFGTLLTCGIGALIVEAGYRRRVFGLLVTGAASHFVLDGLLITPSRFSYVLFWPFETILVPLPMWFHTSSRVPVVIAGSAAAIVWTLRRHLDRR